MIEKLFIVRWDVLGTDSASSWTAGELAVQMGAPLIGHAHVPVYRKLNPSVAGLLFKESLLDYSRYLKKQPGKNFWCAFNSNTDMYLADAQTEMYGHLPFRFESFGELVYYFKQHGLMTSNFLIGHFDYLPKRVTAKSIKEFNEK
jgi:hypothetical protein